MPHEERTLVQCHHCAGSGQLPLSDEMERTLKVFDDGKPRTPTEVGKALGWKGHCSAINNRLEDLRGHKLLRRERVGREWEYSLP